MGSQPDDHRSTGHSPFVRHTPPPAQPAPSIPSLTPGQPCPRPHCGGLVILRFVASPEGAFQEHYCTSCARSSDLRPVHPPPRPRLTVSRACEEALERVCTPSPPSRRRGSDRFDDSTDIVGLSPSQLDAVELYTMFGGECPPDGHIP